VRAGPTLLHVRLYPGVRFPGQPDDGVRGPLARAHVRAGQRAGRPLHAATGKRGVTDDNEYITIQNCKNNTTQCITIRRLHQCVHHTAVITKPRYVSLKTKISYI